MFVLSIPNYICIICATQGSIPAEIGNLLDLEWLDPIEDAAPVGITKMEELPENAPELAKDYIKTYPAIIQKWWLKLRKN